MEAVKEVQETVDVSTLDDAALEQHIAETPDKAEVKEDAKQPEGEVKEEKKEAEPAKPADTLPEDKVTVSKAEWEKAQNRIKEQESFIGRQTTEIGKLREQAKAKMDVIESEMKSGQVDMISDPVNAANKINEYNTAKNEYQAYEKQLAEAQIKDAVTSKIPDFMERMPDIVEVLKNEGLPENIIEAFKGNPWGENPFLLVTLARRAEANKELRSVKAENETLKKKPDEVVKNIEKAFKESKNLTASSGQATHVKANVSEDQISLMSDADLEALLKESD